jgi:transcription antitermination factor NusG
LFCRAPDNAALATVKATRDVAYLLKTGDNEPALLSDSAMQRISAGCDTSGKVVSFGFAVGDMLRFVASSSLSGKEAKILSISDAGVTRVLVDGWLKATVDFKDLAA